MCGRFVQFTLFPLLKEEFNLRGGEPALRPSWNVAPTQDVPAVVVQDGRRLVMCRWGLIPPWSRDPAVGSRMINARAETLAQKPSFKGPFMKHRCLIVADGFYEWMKTPEGKVPYYVHMRDSSPFGFAGLYSDWTSPEGETVRTCTIVTTESNELLAPIHDRMPAIIRKADRDLWLDPDVRDTERLSPLLGPYPSGEMEALEVSRRVNSPANDGPENIKPVG